MIILRNQNECFLVSGNTVETLAYSTTNRMGVEEIWLGNYLLKDTISDKPGSRLINIKLFRDRIIKMTLNTNHYLFDHNTPNVDICSHLCLQFIKYKLSKIKKFITTDEYVKGMRKAGRKAIPNLEIIDNYVLGIQFSKDGHSITLEDFIIETLLIADEDSSLH